MASEQSTNKNAMVIGLVVVAVGVGCLIVASNSGGTAKKVDGLGGELPTSSLPPEALPVEVEVEILTIELAKQLLAEAPPWLYISAPNYGAIDDDAAEVLSHFQGTLRLSGLASLSDAAAKSLGNHDGELILLGLTSLSKMQAESLARHQGKLSVDYGRLQPPVARIIHASRDSEGLHRNRLPIPKQLEPWIDISVSGSG